MLNFFKKNFLENALAKNSFILFVGSILTSVFNYFFHLIIGRSVSVEVYGEAEALISLIAIISVPAATLAMVATKYVSSCKAEDDKRRSHEILNYLNKKVFKYSLPLFLFAALATPFIGNFFKIENNFAFILVWTAMLLSFFSSINSGVLRGWQKFKGISLAGACGATAKLIFGFVMVKLGFALNGIVGSFVLGALATYLVTFGMLKFIRVKKETKDALPCESSIDFQSLRRYIIPVFVGNLAVAILGNADLVLAKHNLSALEAGQYSALSIVAKVIFFATGVVASVLFSMSAENSHRGDSSLRILKMALLLVLGASVFATLIYFLYPAFVLSILFGNKYQEVSSYLGWFAIAVTLFSVSNVIFQYLLSLHKTKIAYALLAVAGALLAGVFLYGKSIGAIIAIVIIAQIIAVVSGTFFLFQGKEKRELVHN